MVPALLWILLAAAPHPPDEPRRPLPFTVASSLLKIRPGQPLPPASEVKLHVARAECEGFQVRVLAPAEGVHADPLTLKGEHGALSVRLYREAFLDIQVPTARGGPKGLFPDPLLPVEDEAGHPLKNTLPYDSTEERPLILYGEVCAREDTPAGFYEGALRLQAHGHREARVPVSVRVEPFAIPATSSLPNTFGISLYSIAKGHGVPPEGAVAQKLLHDYATVLLAHRVSAHGMGLEPPPAAFPTAFPSAKAGQAVLDFRAYDAEMGDFLSGKALPSGARFTTADLREHPRIKNLEQRVAYDRAFREHFAERRWKQLLFFYAKDEPTPEDYPLVLEQAARVHRAKGIPVLVTSAFDTALAPATDLFCPVLNCFFPRRGPATCKNPLRLPELKRRIPSRDLPVFWYQSCMSHGCVSSDTRDPKLEPAFEGWASYMVDASGPLNRAMGPLAYLVGIGGELYFDTVSAYNDRDPWTDVLKFGGNGDGTFFYPGTPERLGGTAHLPVASLRLKTLRDGLEDFEYLTLLDRLGERDFAQEEVKKLVRSGYDITQDPGVWEQVRDELAARLRAASPSPKGAP